MDNGTLAQPAGAVKYPKGLTLYQEGSMSGDMYYLLEGTVGAFKGNVQVATYGPGSVFGEGSLFLGIPREAKLMALTDINVIAINRQNIYSIYTGQPELTYRIMEQMCRRIDRLQRGVPVAVPPQPARPAPAPQPVRPQAAAPQRPPEVKRPVAQPKVETKPATQPKVAAPAPSPVLSNLFRTASWKSALFPGEHGEYTIELQNDSDSIYVDPCTCPLCKEKFQTIKVITSKLRTEGTDSDLRVRYKDIDPMHYDIISCPSCLYSAATDQFDSASPRLTTRVAEQLADYKKDVVIKTGKERDSFTVIAGYYLAIQCAEICFDNHEIIQARHWQKLSRIYQDCEDSAMYRLACENSLREFRFAYDHFDYSPKQMQQMCFIIGDLYQKLDDLETARSYFYQAKSNRDGTSVTKRNADIRLEEIKELLKEQGDD